MSVGSTLDAAFTTLLGKFTPGVSSTGSTGSSGGPGAGTGTGGTGGTTTIEPVTVCITFSGSGSALPLSGLPGVVEIPYPLSIVWVHLYAGDESGAPMVVTASVDLRLTSITSFGASGPIYGAAMPSLTGTASANVDTSAWRVINFVTGDTILFRLNSFAGTATWLTLTMQLRPTYVPIGVSPIVNSGGDTLIDSNGNTLVLRS